MSLIKCEECGKEISNRAKACIHCGCPISNDDTSNVNNSKNDDKNVIKKSGNLFLDKNLQCLCAEFDAVVSDKINESTLNIIYIEELDRNVELLVPNNIKENEKIWKKADEGPNTEPVVFIVKTVSKDPNVKSIPTEKKSKKKVKENKTAIDFVKNYNPNFLVRFFDGVGVKDVIYTLIAFSIIHSIKEGEILILIICIILALILMLIRIIYPFLYLIKYIKKNHIDEAIKNDPNYLNIAICTFNLLPSKRMLWYIKKINIDAGLEIERQISKK